jgi:hypothetical protein
MIAMETMRWSEITTSSSSNGGGGGGGGGNDQSGTANNGNNNSNSNPGAPTIKNHSVTYFSNYLYCFGGYDGRRNHLTLLLYSIKEQRWIRPHHVGNANPGRPLTGENGDDVGVIPMELQESAVGNHDDDGNGNGNDNARIAGPDQQQQQQQLLLLPDQQDIQGLVPFGPGIIDQQQQQQQYVPPGYFQQQQQQQQHQNNHPRDMLGGDTSILVTGNPPPGRNGHSATLATDPDDEDNGRIIIIGGWLGTGPLAASDMHVLDISNAGRRLRWYQPPVKGTPPGPCNMHSADYVPKRREVYVFRGGNGREYLNDLHALNVQTMVWRKVETTGEIPQQRANHSSAVLEETGELFIFGGWYVLKKSPLL